MNFCITQGILSGPTGHEARWFEQVTQGVESVVLIRAHRWWSQGVLSRSGKLNYFQIADCRRIKCSIAQIEKRRYRK